jgi:heavy metal sensor kinase
MSRPTAWLRRAAQARRTIRVRLTLWYVALLALILVAFCSVLYAGLARGIQAEADARLTIAAQQTLALVDIEGNRLDEPVRPEYLPDGAMVTIYNGRGERLFTSDQARVLPSLGRNEVREIRGPWVIESARAPDGAEWRLLTAPVLSEGQPVGAMQLARTQPEVGVALQNLLVLMALAAPATLLLATAGGLFLAGRALGPIDRLTRAAQAIGADDLTRRLDPPPQRDEIGRLALTFNSMLDRLERAFRRQRRFTADAAHELRTPLAMLASQVDVLLERPRPAAEYAHALASMREDMTRLNGLVSELLTLARADDGREALARERLAVGALVDDVLAAMIPLAEARGVHLARGADADAVVEGDQTRLTQLLVNLLDNAVKYTPAGGRVTVAVRREEPWVALEVADTGMGIAPEHLPYLFERFYRGDPARGRADGGAGLGLAISQWIVEAHGGQIAVASQPSQGATFTVRLPLAGDPPPAEPPATRVLTTGAPRR